VRHKEGDKVSLSTAAEKNRDVKTEKTERGGNEHREKRILDIRG